MAAAIPKSATKDGSAVVSGSREPLITSVPFIGPDAIGRHSGAAHRYRAAPSLRREFGRTDVVRVVRE